MVFVGLCGVIFHYRDFEARIIYAFAAVVVVGTANVRAVFANP